MLVLGRSLPNPFCGNPFCTFRILDRRFCEVRDKSGCSTDEEGIFTFMPMTSFGIARFTTKDQKRKFKVWLGKNRQEISYGDKGLFVEDNVGKESRDRKEAIGKVVKALYLAKEGRTDVTRDYNKGVVWVNQEVAAKWRDGKMIFKREGLNIETKYNDLMKELEEKRAKDSDSE